MSKIFVQMTKSEFEKKKIASNSDNTEYTISGTGESYVGTPDILFCQVVFVSDGNIIYTQGNAYVCALINNVVDETTDTYLVADLNEKYENLEVGQTVICPNISIKFTKTGSTSWIKEKITVVD